MSVRHQVEIDTLKERVGVLENKVNELAETLASFQQMVVQNVPAPIHVEEKRRGRPRKNAQAN